MDMLGMLGIDGCGTCQWLQAPAKKSSPARSRLDIGKASGSIRTINSGPLNDDSLCRTAQILVHSRWHESAPSPSTVPLVNGERDAPSSSGRRRDRDRRGDGSG